MSFDGLRGLGDRWATTLSAASPAWSAGLVLLTILIGYALLQLVIRASPSSSAGAKRKRQPRDTVLILGPCDSGKTRLFYSLLGPAYATLATVSSVKPNRLELRSLQADSPLLKTLGEDHTVRPGRWLVDFPGHPRLQYRLNELLPRALCVVYVLDATNKPSTKRAAEHLYDLFIHPDVLENQTPFLLACNKTDLPAAKTVAGVREDLQREIERLRVSRAAALEGEDAAEKFIGVHGKPFALEDAPIPVSLCSVSHAHHCGVMGPLRCVDHRKKRELVTRFYVTRCTSRNRPTTQKNRWRRRSS